MVNILFDQDAERPFGKLVAVPMPVAPVVLPAAPVVLNVIFAIAGMATVCTAGLSKLYS